MIRCPARRAQGRVWSGKRALEVGLVDALGGLSRAVAIAKRELKIPDGENVRLVELSRETMSPLQLLSGGGASLGALADVAQVGICSLVFWDIGSPAQGNHDGYNCTLQGIQRAGDFWVFGQVNFDLIYLFAST